MKRCGAKNPEAMSNKELEELRDVRRDNLRNMSQEETEKALFYVRTRGAGFVDKEEVLKIIGI